MSNISKSHAQALIVRQALDKGYRAFNCSIDPKKQGEITSVNLPKELEDKT